LKQIGVILGFFQEAQGKIEIFIESVVPGIHLQKQIFYKNIVSLTAIHNHVAKPYLVFSTFFSPGSMVDHPDEFRIQMPGDIESCQECPGTTFQCFYRQDSLQTIKVNKGISPAGQ
jgi:hypothetical protein